MDMKKSDLISSIIDYMENAEYRADDYESGCDKTLFAQMDNYLFSLHKKAIYEEKMENNGGYSDEVYKYYYGVVEGLLSQNVDSVNVPCYNDTDNVECVLSFTDLSNGTTMVSLLEPNLKNVSKDYTMIFDFIPNKENIDMVVKMILFNECK